MLLNRRLGTLNFSRGPGTCLCLNLGHLASNALFGPDSYLLLQAAPISLTTDASHLAVGAVLQHAVC